MDWSRSRFLNLDQLGAFGRRFEPKQWLPFDKYQVERRLTNLVERDVSVTVRLFVMVGTVETEVLVVILVKCFHRFHRHCLGLVRITR